MKNNIIFEKSNLEIKQLQGILYIKYEKQKYTNKSYFSLRESITQIRILLWEMLINKNFNI